MRSVSPSIRRTILLVVCALALAACGGVERQPTEYGDVNTKGDGYYGNLMYGCTGVLPDDDGKYTDVKLGTESYCKCLFDGLKETVPFKDAKAFDDAQAKEDAGEIKIPANIAAVQEKCDEEDAS